jgi:regulator of nucleoside diphosphate kinase
MNERPIYIPADDRAKLRLLLDSLGAAGRTGPAAKLREELDRAVVLDANAVPANVVTMNARFEIEDLSTGEVDGYTLVYPDRANVDARMLSVLAPIGTAVLGYAEGDEVEWSTPGGVRRFRIRRVTRSEAAANGAGTAQAPGVRVG